MTPTPWERGLLAALVEGATLSPDCAPPFTWRVHRPGCRNQTVATTTVQSLLWHKLLRAEGGAAVVTEAGRKAATVTIPEKLQRLEARGEPLRLIALDPARSDFEYELTLRADRNDLCGTEVGFTEHAEWWLEWQIIGALVSAAIDRGDPQGRDELLDASKIGLDEVLDVRLRQLEIVEAA